MTETVILSGARTPIGKLSGGLASFSGTDLGGLAIAAALDRSGIAGTDIDWALQISDQAMVDMVYRLLHEEGWFFGSSAGINVCGAIEVARQLGPGHTIVTMLCDGGGKYRQKLFNPDWLAGKGFLID